MKRGVAEGSEESEGRTARGGGGSVVRRLSGLGRYWPGGRRGGSPLDGVASEASSPGVQ